MLPDELPSRFVSPLSACAAPCHGSKRRYLLFVTRYGSHQGAATPKQLKEQVQKTIVILKPGSEHGSVTLVILDRLWSGSYLNYPLALQ